MKKHKKLISVLIVLALLWAGAYAYTTTIIPYRYGGEPLPETEEGQVRFVKDGEATPYLAKYDEEGNMIDVGFKVITVSDTHLTDASGDFVFEKLSELIDMEKPDLVVLLGDLILSGKEDIPNKLAAFFEQREQYWSFVLGNHDGQEYEGEEDRYEQHRWWYGTMTGSPYCISLDEGGDEVYGFGNCAVNIRIPTGISHTLFFTDNSLNGSNGGAFDESIVEWYEKRVGEIKEENGGVTVPSTVFMHRPIGEYQLTWDYLNTGSNEGNPRYVYGDIIEEIEYGGDCNMFEKAKELGSTQTFICGHEHKNDTRLVLDGINLIYTQGLHFETYGRSEAIRWHVFYWLNRECNWFTEGGTGFVFTASGDTVIAPVYLPVESYV